MCSMSLCGSLRIAVVGGFENRQSNLASLSKRSSKMAVIYSDLSTIFQFDFCRHSLAINL